MVQKSEISDKKGKNDLFLLLPFLLTFLPECKKVKSQRTSLPRTSSLHVDVGHHQPWSLTPCDLVQSVQSCDGILLLEESFILPVS